MTEQQLNRIWQKPMDKARDLTNTHSPVIRSIGVSSWAKSIYEALEAQKEAKNK